MSFKKIDLSGFESPSRAVCGLAVRVPASDEAVEVGRIVVPVCHSPCERTAPNSSMSLLGWRKSVWLRPRDVLLAKTVRIRPIMTELPELDLPGSLGRDGG